MKLISETIDFAEAERRGRTLTYLPDNAVDVAVYESEFEVVVVYTLMDKKDFHFPAGHC